MRIPSSRRASIFGIVLGLVLGFAGMASGVYFGIMKPAMDAGAPLLGPFRAIAVISAILIFLVIVGVHFLRASRARRPAEDRWERGNSD